MPPGFQSTLLLTVLLAIGLVFFLRAASKDRTTVVDIQSPRPPLEVLEGLSNWLEARGWNRDGGDAERQLLRFSGKWPPAAPWPCSCRCWRPSAAGCFGSGPPSAGSRASGWPLLLIGLGPLAGLIYTRRAARTEQLELRLLEATSQGGSALRLRAHRDELIAIEQELAGTHLNWPVMDPCCPPRSDFKPMPCPGWVRRRRIFVSFSVTTLSLVALVLANAGERPLRPTD